MKIDLGSISGTDILKDSLIIALLLLLIFEQECNRTAVTSGGDLPVKTTTKYIHDTVALPSTPQKVQISYIDTGSTHFIRITETIDTPAIVRQYLKTYQYLQQFNSKQYNATFKAYISHDSIYNPELSVAWLSPTETINQITTPVATGKLKMFLGLHFGGSPTQFDLGPQVWLLTKTDHLYGISNDLALKQPNAELHVGWKLHW